MNVAYLCLGGNMGNREAYLAAAVKRIEEEAGKVTALSELYETEAWGVSGQQPYLNRCVEVETALAPTELLRVLLEIEKEQGRQRDPLKTYEPRTLDLDILFYNREIIDRENLQIPHPRLHLRNFVLKPLSEIAGSYLHPVLNKTIFNLLTECGDTSELKLYHK